MSLLSEHFSDVASLYDDLRVTDLEPVNLIADALAGRPAVNAADVGCGTGRYMVELMRRLGSRLHVCFVDCNRDMLAELRTRLDSLGLTGFDVLQCPAEKLRLLDHSLDCMLVFNAIHHFDLGQFMQEVGRTLRQGGLLFIYTRLPDQNRRSIWGQCFPDFARKEKRLHEAEHIARTIRSTGGLVVRRFTRLSYRRTATRDCLVQRAKSKHYSTFCFYEADELERAIEGFEARLTEEFGTCEILRWVDENVMITVERA
jgi:ubiquinone/menaquinone biosynthesis C-methylase UbiE